MSFLPETSILSRSFDEWFNLIYDSREMCKKPAPIGYSMGLTGAHLVAFPIYVLAFYTLYAEKSINFKVYKKYLATHVVSNFLFELHLSVVMKPVLYLPYPIIRMTGASFLTHLNGFVSFIIFYCILSSTGWSILELLYYRFKLISNNNLISRWVRKCASIIKGGRRSLVVFSGCTFGFLSLCITGIFEQTKYKNKLEILSEFPELLCTSAIILPKTSNDGIKPIHLFNLSVLISTVIGCFQCISMGIVSFLALDEMVRESRSSLRTIAMHRSFLVSLFCQIGVHGIMLGFPLFIYIVSIIFHFDGNEVGYVAIVLASLHGAMSTLAMILFNRPLFQLAKSTLQSLFFPRNVSVGDLSLVSSSLSRPNDSVRHGS